MFRFDPKDLRKQLRRLGLRDVKIEPVNAEEVVIRTEEGKELVISSPQVLLMKMKGGAVMLQVMGQGIEEREAIQEEQSQQFSEEDIRFVMEQTGVSIDEARQALEEAGGDIAAAIMLIEERKRALEDS